MCPTQMPQCPERECNNNGRAVRHGGNARTSIPLL
jgi:hypothetical protein